MCQWFYSRVRERKREIEITGEEGRNRGRVRKRR